VSRWTRRTRWISVIAAVSVVIAASVALTPSPACRPIGEAGASYTEEFGAPFMRWATDTFGAAIGYPLSFVRWRRGYLEDETAFRNQLKGLLKPFDVLVVKNGYKLTDRIIPGVFTHAAIWLGDEAALREAGLWDYPDMVTLHEKIAEGLTVIEAEPGGTVLVDLDRIFDSDQLTIIRIPAPPDDPVGWRCELATLAIGQIGRPYDYSFDLDSTDRLSCSEVVTGTFHDVTWQVRLLFGRSTVLPDDIIRLALSEGSGLRVVAYFAGISPDGWKQQSIGGLEAQLDAACAK
jgi:Permuted papain-like amidase enzyme, YaeF/YiiX, C92 family